VLQNSTSASFSFDVVEANGGTFHIGTGVVGAPSTLLVRSAASGPPVGFGSQSTTATGTIFTPVSPKADAINLNWNGTGGFAPGFATNVDGNVGISHNGNGFSFLGYMEVRADAAVVGSPQYIALELTNHGSPFDPNSMQPIIDTVRFSSFTRRRRA